MVERSGTEHATGRAEVLAAFDDLRTAVSRLVEAAQVRLPRQAAADAGQRQAKQSEPPKEEVSTKYSIVPEWADLSSPAEATQLPDRVSARSTPREPEDRFTLVSDDREGHSLADRVVDLQERLGGFLK